MAAQTKDMTQGNAAKLIVTFAIPLMLGNAFQQLYTMTDTAIVGQFVGVHALAALGAADWLNWLVLGVVTGFTQGFSILISQRFGAEDEKGMKKAAAMSLLLSAVIAAVFTLLGLLLFYPVLLLMQTPADIIGLSSQYLTILFSGIFIITAYNMFASILRAVGDSKTPFVAMIVASIINVGLDFLFVVGFNWGVTGAAAATVTAQAFSAVFCLAAVLRIPQLKLSREDWQPSFATIRKLLELGTPMAFQNGIIAVGGLVVQTVINGFGFILVAGFTATNKLYGLLEMAATSFGFSMATFSGQNLGAGKYRRIYKGTHSAVRMAVLTAVFISAVSLIFGKAFLSLFISGEPEEAAQVMRVAYHYLEIMCFLLPVLYLLHVYRSVLQGMGDTVTPMVSGIVELAMRISVAIILPRLLGEEGIYYAEVAAWIGAVALLTSVYYRRIRGLLPLEGKPLKPEAAPLPESSEDPA